MTKRQAPCAGYDYGTKRQYRRAVWKTLTAGIPTKSKVRALLMPSLEGDEIDVALSNGIREYNLHVVDRNPAIVAHLKRRYPRIHTYGVELTEAVDRIRRGGVGPFMCANLDLCGPLTEKLMQTLRTFAYSGCMAPVSRVAVTVLRGREKKVQQLFEPSCASRTEELLGLVRQLPWVQPHFTDLDLLRVQAAELSLTVRGRYVAETSRVEIYRSIAGHQTMLWAVFTLLHPELRQAVDAGLSHPSVDVCSVPFERLLPDPLTY